MWFCGCPCGLILWSLMAYFICKGGLKMSFSMKGNEEVFYGINPVYSRGDQIVQLVNYTVDFSKKCAEDKGESGLYKGMEVRYNQYHYDTF